MQETNDTPGLILERHFGHASFRPGQEEVVAHVLAGGERVVVLPTGGGKSLCYLLPALLLPEKTLVVSPLIALIADQVEHAERAGIAALFWKRESSDAELARARIIFASPEFLLRYTERLRALAISHLVLDEAHCVSDWGGSFRPSYAEIANIREYCPCANVSLFTASANPEQCLDLARRFSLRAPRYFVHGFDRPNIAWHCQKTPFPLLFALHYLLENPGRAIVYCRTRLLAARAAALLQDFDLPARPFHAGMNERIRAELQRAFAAGEVRILCATSAFGMGVDVPSVRTVIHLNTPNSCNAYYQEAGRAGRDGEPALALLLVPPKERQYDSGKALFAFFARARKELPSCITEGTLGGLCKRYRSPLEAGAVLAFLLHHGVYRRHAGRSPAEYRAAADWARRIRSGLQEEEAARKREQEWARGYTSPECLCRRRALLVRYEEPQAPQLDAERTKQEFGVGERSAPTSAATEGKACTGCDRCGSPFSARLEGIRKQTEEDALLITRACALPWTRRAPLLRGKEGARLDALLRFFAWTMPRGHKTLR